MRREQRDRSLGAMMKRSSADGERRSAMALIDSIDVTPAS